MNSTVHGVDAMRRWKWQAALIMLQTDTSRCAPHFARELGSCSACTMHTGALLGWGMWVNAQTDLKFMLNISNYKTAIISTHKYFF